MITWDEGILVVQDLKTEVGTLVNGKKVGEEVLRNRDVIGLGDFRVRALRRAQERKRKSGMRTSDAERWAQLLARRDSQRSVIFTEDTEDARCELTLWGDGEGKLDVTGEDERFGVDCRFHESAIEALNGGLTRASFPDVPKVPATEEHYPCWISAYQDEDFGQAELVDAMTDRSPEYAEVLSLLRSIITLVRAKGI